MPNKHALIIGVDRYPALEPQYQLGGCVNDALLMEQLLVEHFGFPPASIVALHNEAASRAAIFEAMEALLARVDVDDIVHVHFSGHGSRRTSATQAQGTGKDSTIMPSDSGRHPLPNLDIVDQEIQGWLQKLCLKTQSISLLFDCCHSGTITRDPFAARVRSAPEDTRSLQDMGIDPRALPAVPRAPGEDRDSWAALGSAYVVLSGCRDDELAHEFSDQRGGEPIRNGALTHFLAGALLAARPGDTFRDVFESAFAQVNSRFPSQHPRIEGAQDRELFGGRDAVPFRFVLASAVEGSRVHLAGGAAHGLQPGARWAAYAPGTKRLEEASPLAVLRIHRVEVLSAEAVLVDGSPSIPTGARCVLLEPAAEAFRLGVDLGEVPAVHVGPLRSAIEASALLQADVDADAAALRVYRVSPAQLSAASPADAAFSHGWRVVDRSGAAVMPLIDCASEDAVDRLLANAETLARYRNALALGNPDSRLKVRFRLLREDAGGEWKPLASEGERLQEGDSVAFELVNEESTPVFLSVLDFGVSGRVQLLYPPNTSSERLEPGQTLRIGTGKRRIRLGLPDTFQGSVGNETFKAFVTLEEADFSWLQQAGTRSPAGPRSRLRRLFEAAYCGPKTRDASLDAGEDVDSDWCAINRGFELHRALG